jgi:hypothetical protein
MVLDEGWLWGKKDANSHDISTFRHQHNQLGWNYCLGTTQTLF